MDKKGQAFSEFIMTYGWAILVVVVAVGSLWYFGVFDRADPLGLHKNLSNSTNSSVDFPADISGDDIMISKARYEPYNCSGTQDYYCFRVKED